MNGFVVTMATPMCFSSLGGLPNRSHTKPTSHFPGKSQSISLSLHNCWISSLFSSSCANNRFSGGPHSKKTSHFTIRSSSSAGSSEYTEEPATNVKFQKSLTLPGCSAPFSLLGTGYREKTFAIIGVKVYAAGLYINKSVISEIQNDLSLFNAIFQAPMEKSLQIVLVRDVDGKTFWDALDEAISPRIKALSADDKSALSTFRSIFQGRPLRNGTLIFLTWLDPSKMLVCVSSEGFPSSVDATIESGNVASALFDVFFGETPVSPTLKTSVVNELAALLK